MTVVTRTVKVPRPPAPKPKLPSPDSVEPVSSARAKTKRGNSAAPKKRSVSAQPVPGRSGKHAESDRSSGSPLATGSRDHNDLLAPTSSKPTKAAAAAATKTTTKASKQARKGKAQ